MTWKYFELNKRSKFTINAPFRETGNIEIGEIVKQGITCGPVMCFVLTARVNNIG